MFGYFGSLCHHRQRKGNVNITVVSLMQKPRFDFQRQTRATLKKLQVTGAMACLTGSVRCERALVQFRN